MNLVMLPEAETEARHAAKWYEEKQTHLGHAFLDELEASLRGIQSNPLGQPLLESVESPETQYRRCLLNRFPYLVIFTIRESEILVVAVAHAHRKPGYWADRIS